MRLLFLHPPLHRLHKRQERRRRAAGRAPTLAGARVRMRVGGLGGAARRTGNAGARGGHPVGSGMWHGGPGGCTGVGGWSGITL
jgi:hypothetical protein